MTSSTTLGEAIDALLVVAQRAGIAPDTARAEALALAAAVGESAPRAADDWSAAVPGATVQDFFDAASRGRRWRGAPTAVLTELVAQGSPEKAAYAEALAEVASAACGLGEPTMRVIGNASVAAAAQLQAAGAKQLTPQPGTPGGSPDPTPGLNLPDGLGVLGQLGVLERIRALGGFGTPSPTPTETPPADGSAAPQAVVQAEEPEAQPKRSLEELLAELDELTGLKRVKREVHRQVALLKVEKLRTEAGLKSPTITRHLVFTGNPGTGKTTVARLVSGIYAALGLLSKGQLIEVDRSELVAGYLGQTAAKTAEVVASAVGGVLFIDEAYSLTGDQYGEEAVDTLVKEMEDRRDDLVVIVAGYPLPMIAFVAQNPGLASRFRTTIEFDDYTDDELTGILTGLAADADYEVTPPAADRFREILAGTVRDSSFGNGRFARNLLEAAIGRHAWRLRDVQSPSTDQLRQLLPEDFTEESEEPPTEGTDTDAPRAGELDLAETTDEGGTP